MEGERKLGFVGLGVMGGAMCANLTTKSGLPVLAFDAMPSALEGAVSRGAVAASSMTEIGSADIVFLSLPSINEVEVVAEELLGADIRPRMIVDMSTCDVSRTRSLAARLAAAEVVFVDAPVGRLRMAAQQGTLLITVGATDEEFLELKPLLACMGSDIVHAGSSGNGQVFKILNNMVLFLNMNALAEALAIGRAAGVDGRHLFESLMLGSADSFALRNTAMATLIPDEFPEKAFPTNYAIKDLSLALSLASSLEIPADAARQTMELLERTRDAGFGLNYYPSMIRLIEGRE